MNDRLRAPDELTIEDGFLVFAEENQRFVDWGIPVPVGGAPDPVVWQRVNGKQSAWFSEDMPFSSFVIRRLAFAKGLTLDESLGDPA